jgi:HEPN pEK499 p136
MPKELVINFVPNCRLTDEYKASVGLVESVLPDAGLTLRGLIKRMRHSVAHFDIDSDDDAYLVDRILFKDRGNREPYAAFKASEIGGFLHFYADALINNLDRHH